jgi:hypothetical protein
MTKSKTSGNCMFPLANPYNEPILDFVPMAKFLGVAKFLDLLKKYKLFGKLKIYCALSLSSFPLNFHL